MSIEQVKAFMEEVKTNSSLQEKLEALQTDDIDNAITQGLQIAKEAGFVFSKEDFLTFNAQTSKDTELADSELEQVSGGGTYTGYTNNGAYKCTGRV